LNPNVISATYVIVKSPQKKFSCCITFAYEYNKCFTFMMLVNNWMVSFGKFSVVGLFESYIVYDVKWHPCTYYSYYCSSSYLVFRVDFFKNCDNIMDYANFTFRRTTCLMCIWELSHSCVVDYASFFWYYHQDAIGLEQKFGCFTLGANLFDIVKRRFFCYWHELPLSKQTFSHI
jgi:hypothetical protein